uniref:Glycosyltransferase RgtA/B/C/D-like domain-containing protein n=2 Tax=cellular organisms TaxID=131567 RepID=A0A7J3TJC6_9EURY
MNLVGFGNNKLLFATLLLIALMVTTSNIYFVFSNDVPQSWDPALHMYYSLIYFHLIKNFDMGNIVKVSNYYPPFFHLSSTLLYFLFGFSEKVAILTNIIYYFVLVYSVFRIGEILKDRKVGIISSIVVSVFPVLIEFQRVYMIDFALTSLVALTIYFYLRSKDFRDTKYSLLFGISFGLTELTKWIAFIYILPAIFAIFLVNYSTRCPYCYEVVKNGLKHGIRRFCSKKHLRLYEKVENRTNQYLNVGLSIILTFFTAAWWYLPNLNVTLARLTYFANIGGREGDPTFLTLQGWIYYANALIDHIGLLFALFFLISLFYFYKRDRLMGAMILISVAIPYVILTLLSNKDPRYIIPTLPFLAVSIGMFVGDLIESRSGKVLTSLILLFGVLNISAITFGQPALDSKIFHPKSPSKEDWKINELLKTIENSGGEGKVVVVLPDHQYLNGQSLEFYRLKNGYRFAVYNGVYIGYTTFVRNFDKISYIVIIEPREHKGVYGEEEKSLYEFFYEHKSEFKNVATFKLPDGTDLLLYKREQ